MKFSNDALEVGHAMKTNGFVRSGLKSFAEYQAALCGSVYPIRLQPNGPARDFTARLDEARIGAISLVKAHASAAFLCTRESAKSTNADCMILSLQERGRTSYVHRDRKFECAAGTIALYDGWSELEGEQHGAAHALVVRLPSALVAHYAPSLRSRVATVIKASEGSGRLLALTLRELHDFSRFAGPQQVQALQVSLLQLTDAAFYDSSLSSDERWTACSDPRFQRLQSAIRDSLTDPDLSVAKLCRRLATSRSSLYEITRSAGTGVERLVLAARLDRAQTLLAEQERDQTTVTEIALSSGFKEVSHFSRSFKKRFGVSPHIYRVRQAKGFTN